MSIFDILTLLAGVGIFLYGMFLMSESLQKVAGAKLEKILERLTDKPLKGVALGTGVTAVIQSSSATTVMIVGFINAGIMKLSQAVGVIMGANIGTTVTAQILRLGDIKSDNVFMKLLKPSSFCAVLIVIGIIMTLFMSKKRHKDIGGIVLGLGLLFFGMTVMEGALSPLSHSPYFGEMMIKFQNPLYGVAAGTIITAIIQSSSASVGILQALTATGAISFATAVPIIMGQNIGTCITVVLACIGANRNSKRAALIHLSFNVIGTVIWLSAIYALQSTIGLPFWHKVMNRGSIADFHSIFNIANTIILLPMSGLLIKLANFCVKPLKGEVSEEKNLLDDRFLSSPGLAIEQCKKTIVRMGELAHENFKVACGLLHSYDPKEAKLLFERENLIDRMESTLGNYLVKVTGCSLSETESRQATEIMHALSDYERIGDYSVNIAEAAEDMNARGDVFSKSAVKEIRMLEAAVSEILELSMKAYATDDEALASHVEPLEEVIDMMKESLKTRHVERLREGKCKVDSGYDFLELLNNFERIGDHCSNVALYVIQLHVDGQEFDPHEHLRVMHEATSDEYKVYYRYFIDKYLDPLELEKCKGKKKK